MEKWEINPDIMILPYQWGYNEQVELEYWKNKNKKEKKMTTEFIPHILSNDSITIFLGGVKTFPSSHLQYKDVCDCVKKGDKKKLEKLFSKRVGLPGLTVKDDVVLWDGEELHNTATKRLFEMKEKGFSITPLVNFLKNCKANPHYHIVIDKLYDFLESKGMPLTEDGCFLAYKYCERDYFDSHTKKTYKFSPGAVVTAPKEDRQNVGGTECSSVGIHVGNWEYSGNSINNNTKRVMLVKVNPADVLSIPVGTDAMKIRVWQLKVLNEITGVSEEVVVSEKGEKIAYKAGDSFSNVYIDGDKRERFYMGKIKNVGKVYLELEVGATERDLSSFNNVKHNAKVRLKIANIKGTL